MFVLGPSRSQWLVHINGSLVSAALSGSRLFAHPSLSTVATHIFPSRSFFFLAGKVIVFTRGPVIR